MYRDITEIPKVVNCIKITDDKNLIVYTNDNTTIFTLIGDKYYGKENYGPNTPQNETICYTREEISTLPSPWDFITPIYHIFAVVSVIAIFYTAYKLILYPFFRKRV